MNLWRAPLPSLLAVLTIGLSLFLGASFILGVFAARALLTSWGAQASVTLYLDRSTTDEQARTLAQTVRAENPSLQVTYVDRTMALQRLRGDLGDLAGALEGLSQNPLPPSLELSSRTALQPSGVRMLAARLEQLPSVQEVDYGREWLDKLEALGNGLRVFGTGALAIVLGAALLAVEGAWGQAPAKRPLTHNDYDSWRTVQTPALSRDGKYVLVRKGSELGYLAWPERTTTALFQAEWTVRGAQFSADGRWIAYSSNETGNMEVYVSPFPSVNGKWQVSNAGGQEPKWRSDGKELFYMSRDGKIMAVSVSTGASFEAGTPVALFQTHRRQPMSSQDLFSYDVSSDGQRFLIATKLDEPNAAPLSVLLNWASEMEK